MVYYDSSSGYVPHLGSTSFLSNLYKGQRRLKRDNDSIKAHIDVQSECASAWNSQEHSKIVLFLPILSTKKLYLVP